MCELTDVNTIANTRLTHSALRVKRRKKSSKYINAKPQSAFSIWKPQPTCAHYLKFRGIFQEKISCPIGKKFATKSAFWKKSFGKIFMIVFIISVEWIGSNLLSNRNIIMPTSTRSTQFEQHDLYYVYTIKQTSSNHQVNVFKIHEHDGCSNCLMFAWRLLDRVNGV